MPRTPRTALCYALEKTCSRVRKVLEVSLQREMSDTSSGRPQNKLAGFSTCPAFDLLAGQAVNAQFPSARAVALSKRQAHEKSIHDLIFAPSAGALAAS